VIVLGSVIHIEDYCHLRIKTVETQRREIRFSVKNQTIGSVRNRTIHQEERFYAAVRVGPRMAQLGPTLVSVLNLQTNCHTTGRGSPRSVEYVSGNGAHVGSSLAADHAPVSNFFSRNSVILLCSAAATGSSSRASCPSRARRAASISSEVLPVAQIMKMNPNFCS
jgi:hypothetical protein